ncbi:MAG: hypothetical protein EZS28_048913, partial [Streblomastix strix]
QFSLNFSTVVSVRIAPTLIHIPNSDIRPAYEYMTAIFHHSQLFYITTMALLVPSNTGCGGLINKNNNASQKPINESGAITALNQDYYYFYNWFGSHSNIPGTCVNAIFISPSLKSFASKYFQS